MPTRRYLAHIACALGVALTALIAATSAISATTATDTEALTVTAPIPASITINRVSDGTSAVTNFAFPETAPGATSAASTPYRVEITDSTGDWEVSADVTSTFTEGTTGATLADSAILVDGAIQGGTYVDLSTARTLQSPILRATHNSAYFTFKFAPAGGADSGTYTGTVTITAGTL